MFIHTPRLERDGTVNTAGTAMASRFVLPLANVGVGATVFLVTIFLLQSATIIPAVSAIGLFVTAAAVLVYPALDRETKRRINQDVSPLSSEKLRYVPGEPQWPRTPRDLVWVMAVLLGLSFLISVSLVLLRGPSISPKSAAKWAVLLCGVVLLILEKHWKSDAAKAINDTLDRFAGILALPYIVIDLAFRES